MKNIRVKRLVFAGLCLALCMVLPLLTGQIPEIGKALAPMHIPVLLCGFVCGWPWGLAVGVVAPLLRFAIFGMPALFPTGIAMTFELGVYGAVSGLLYRKLPDSPLYVYISLLCAMLSGRVAWGLATWTLLGSGFTLKAFLAGAFVTAVPGIVCHILLVPLLVFALRRAKLILR